MVRAFRDRSEAGELLSQEMLGMSLDNTVVLALPRGGVPVAQKIAEGLSAPLDVLLVRKLGVPHQPELGMGAIAERDVLLLNDSLVTDLGVSQAEITRVRTQEQEELTRRSQLYRAGRQRLDITGTTAVVVDDGLATGFTARAAVSSAKKGGATQVVLAVPVGSSQAVSELGRVADAVVCLRTPRTFRAVGEWYLDFTQVTDQQVISILSSSNQAAD